MKKLVLVIIVLFSLIFPFNINALENDKITLYLFHGDGCPHCSDEQDFLESIKDDYKNLEIVLYEVWYNESNALLLEKIEKVFDINRSGVPTTVIGKTVITGYNEARASTIKRAIKFYQENEYVDVVKKIEDGSIEDELIQSEVDQEIEKTNDEHGENDPYIVDEFSLQEKNLDDELTINLPLFGKVNLKNVTLTSASVIIGFIDGFNPCAMWILLFLISVLIGMRNKKRMWVLGLTFLITSALVYMIIMLSWINVAVKITTIVWVRNIIAIIALIGGVLNLKSFLKSNKSGCLVVDDKKRKSILNKIKKFTHEKSFVLALLGVVGLAISVNLVELACSAGLPLIFSELLAINNVSSFMKFVYTLLYIIFFLIDDLVVFFIAMFTMKVTGISTKYGKYSHLLGGVVMLLIGVLLLIAPDLLMFNW